MVAGGFSHVVIDAVEKAGTHRIVGFIDDVNPPGATSWGYEVLGNRDALGRLREAGKRDFIVAVGDGKARRELTDLVKAAGFELATVIHPFSSLARQTSIGPGTLIGHGVLIGAGTTVGAGAILADGAAVGHDSSIGDFVHLTSGVHVGAKTTIGDDCFVGMGSTIISDITVGRQAFVCGGKSGRARHT